MEKKQWWTFTFGYGQQHEGMYVRIYGTFDSTRKIMFEIYGQDWSFQYNEADWKDWENKDHLGFMKRYWKKLENNI